MTERLQKYLARAGVASRRHAEGLITAGRVTVNNQRVTELGSRVEKGDLVAVDGKLVTPAEDRSYYVLYKPSGVVTTLDDPQGRPTVGDYVQHLGKRLFPVGRLDYDAEGALILTDDGELAHKLTHPSFEVERTYLAKVKGEPTDATLEKLRGGVRLEDGMATPVSVDVFERAERNTWIKLVVAEGRPHLIKRLCAAVGHPVVRLFRPMHAGVPVEGMKPGEVRALSRGELELAMGLADGAENVDTPELRLPARRHGHGPELPPEPVAPVGGYKAPRRKPSSEADDEVRTERPKGKVRGERQGAFGGSRERVGSGFGERGERPSRGGFGGARRGPGAGGFKARGERGSGEGGERPARGGFKSRGAGGDRPSRGGFGEARRGPGAGGFKPRGERSFGEGSERPSRGGFGDSRRGPSAGAFKPRGERSFGEGSERPSRGGFKPRGEGGDRPSRGGFGEARRGPGAGGFKPRGERSFGERSERPSRGGFKPRGEGGDRPSRGGFGEA
ncbi:MAG: hypothetical protein RL653_1655, partial [Pseudomonadota bacterium]